MAALNIWAVILEFIAAVMLSAAVLNPWRHVDDDLIIAAEKDGRTIQSGHLRDYQRTLPAFWILTTGFALELITRVMPPGLLADVLTNPESVGFFMLLIGLFYIVKRSLLESHRETIAKTYGDDFPQRDMTTGMSGNAFRSAIWQKYEIRFGFPIVVVAGLLLVWGAVYPFLLPQEISASLIVVALVIPLLFVPILCRKKRMEKIEQNAQQVH